MQYYTVSMKHKAVTLGRPKQLPEEQLSILRTSVAVAMHRATKLTL